MKNSFTIWCFVVITIHLDLGHCSDPTELKTTKYGTVRGMRLKSRDGRPYYSYTGIPYARPPIGELRFEVRTRIRD